MAKTIIERGAKRAIEGPLTGIAAIDAFASIWHNRSLLATLVQRDINTRYRGSALGMAWLVLAPALMAIAYTYLFGFLFKARFSGGGLGHTWVGIFLGTTLYQAFSEPVGRATSLIQDQSSFVKKIVVPLRILPVVPVIPAMMSWAVSLAILCLAHLALFGPPPASTLAIPALMVPLFMFVVGICWLVSACSAFVRDLRQVVAFALTILLFLSPVFYPAEMIPSPLREIALLNPVAFAIESSRQAFLSGILPSWEWVLAYVGMSFGSFAVGYATYARLQDSFADVI